MEMSDLTGKVAVITGASGGMGSHIARRLAEQGMKLAICDLHAEALEHTTSLLNGAEIMIQALDITNEAEVVAFFENIRRTYGKLHVVVNCAAIWDQVDAVDINEKRWDRMLDINLKGAFFICRESIKIMRENGGGSIINFASTAGESGSTRPAAHYAASKGGLIALSKSLAREGAADQIRVNVISPGPTDTPMLNILNEEQRHQFGERTLLGRVGKPDDMANAVLYLASDSSGWVTGEVMRVNGGSLL